MNIRKWRKWKLEIEVWKWTIGNGNEFSMRKRELRNEKGNEK